MSETEQSDVGADEETPHNPQATTERPKTNRWSTPAKIASAAIALVGAATGVFTIVQALTRDASSAETLLISAAAASTVEREFALPLALIGDEGFPSAANVCGPEQLAWLEGHAHELDRRFRIDMRNVATEGAMLALVDFRAESEVAINAQATHILVNCPPDASVSVSRSALLSVDVSGDTAHFRPLRGTPGASSIPDLPVSWNLAPGESGVIDIKVTSQLPMKGHLLFTLLSGREKADLAIDGSEFEIPGLWQRGETFLSVGENGLECYRETRDEIAVCSDTDLAQLFEARDSLVSRS